MQFNWRICVFFLRANVKTYDARIGNSEFCLLNFWLKLGQVLLGELGSVTVSDLAARRYFSMLNKRCADSLLQKAVS